MTEDSPKEVVNFYLNENNRNGWVIDEITENNISFAAKDNMCLDILIHRDHEYDKNTDFFIPIFFIY